MVCILEEVKIQLKGNLPSSYIISLKCVHLLVGVPYCFFACKNKNSTVAKYLDMGGRCSMVSVLTSEQQ